MKRKNLICAITENDEIDSVVFHYSDNEYCTFRRKLEYARQWMSTWHRESSDYDAHFKSTQELINMIKTFSFENGNYIEVTYMKTKKIYE